MSVSSARDARRRLRLLASVALGVLAAGPVFGQAVDIPAALDADLKAPPTVATVQYGHQFGANVEDGGTLAVDQVGQAYVADFRHA